MLLFLLETEVIGMFGGGDGRPEFAIHRLQKCSLALGTFLGLCAGGGQQRGTYPHRVF